MDLRWTEEQSLVFDSLMNTARTIKVTVEISPKPSRYKGKGRYLGLAWHHSRRVWVKSSLPLPEAAEILAHELAHIVIYDSPLKPLVSRSYEHERAADEIATAIIKTTKMKRKWNRRRFKPEERAKYEPLISSASSAFKSVFSAFYERECTYPY